MVAGTWASIRTQPSFRFFTGLVPSALSIETMAVAWAFGDFTEFPRVRLTT